MFSQPRRSQWPPSYSWEFPGTLHRTLPGPVLWHQIFISENFSLCNSLDQNQIFSVHFSEVLYGAAPASELIVWIVLSHHYSIVVPAHQTWLTSLCSVKTYIIAPCSFLLRIHILFRWYWVSAHNTSSLQPGCRSTYRDTCRWGPGWRPPQCSQWRGGWQWRKESPWCRARWCPPGRPACSDRWPGRRPRWEPDTDCPRPDTCTDLKTDLCQAGSDVTAHLLTGSCCQLAGWWTARQARRESRWRHFNNPQRVKCDGETHLEILYCSSTKFLSTYDHPPAPFSEPFLPPRPPRYPPPPPPPLQPPPPPPKPP